MNKNTFVAYLIPAHMPDSDVIEKVEGSLDEHGGFCIGGDPLMPVRDDLWFTTPDAAIEAAEKMRTEKIIWANNGIENWENKICEAKRRREKLLTLKFKVEGESGRS